MEENTHKATKFNPLIYSLSLAVLIVALAVAYYLVIFIPKQTAEKRAEDAKALTLKQEQDQKEYVAKRSNECYAIYEKERKQFNNVEGQFYNAGSDKCIIRYTTDEYKGVDCKKEYGSVSSLELECRLGIFTKEF